MSEIVPNWEFEHRITHPNGFRVQVLITVPADPSSPPQGIADSSEHAQMTASRAMTQVQKSMEEGPF